MLSINPVFPLPFIVALALLAATISVTAYRKITHTNTTSLLYLRLLSLFCLFLLALRPSMKSVDYLTQKDRLYIVTDNSDSMTIKDMPNGQSRSQAIEQNFKRNVPLFEKLQKVYDVKKHAFASDLNQSTTQDISPKLTAIGSALKKTAVDPQIRKVKGILLFSDGLSNSGTSINKAIATLNKKNIPVYSITLGQESYQGEIVDGRITQFDCPQTIRHKNDLNLKVSFALKGFKGKTAKLQILIDGELVQSHQIIPSETDQSFEQELSLKTNSLSAGYHKITAHLVTNEKEITPLNNHFDNYLQVTKGSLQLLVVTTAPSPEFKFLNRVLSSFDDIDTDVPNPFYLRSEEGKKYLNDLNIEEYDLVIFQNPDLNIIPKSFIEKCQQSMNSRNLGILFSGASINSKFQQKKLLLDYLYTSQSTAKLISEPKHVSLTQQGSSHFITAFLEEQNLKQWPSLDGVSNTAQVTQSAQCLLRLDETPLLLTSTHKQNRSAWLNTNAFWQLVNHEKSKIACRTLWLRIIYYLTSRENILSTNLSLFTSKTRVQVTTPFSLKADFIDAQSLPIKKAKVFLKNQTPDQQKHEVLMPYNKYFYNHQISLNTGGLYTFSAYSSWEGHQIKSNEVKVHITEPRVEFDRILTDKKLMANIAKATNGQNLTLEELPELLNSLIKNAQLRTVSQVTSDKELWDNIFTYLLITLLLCAEWQFRRRKALP